MAPRIIGLNGKKGSGKDTAGEYLVKNYGYKRVSFAADLKRSAAAALGLPADETTFEEWKNDPQARIKLTLPNRSSLGPLGMDVEVVNISVREYLQFYGTEAHRDIFGADFWTRILIETLDPDEFYVITDSRFVNECTAVRSAGGKIVVIERPGTDSTDTHASEEDLPYALIDTVLLNDGSIGDLYRTLDSYMTNGSTGAPA